MIVYSVLSNYVLCTMSSDPKQNVALQFWSTETVLWKGPFHLTSFSVHLMLFPLVSYGSSLYMSQLYVDSREADRLSSMNILLGAYTGCNALYSRHLVGTCVYTAVCLCVILDAEW